MNIAGQVCQSPSGQCIYARLRQPLTEPIMTPFTKYFWMKG